MHAPFIFMVFNERKCSAWLSIVRLLAKLAIASRPVTSKINALWGVAKR